MRIRDYTLGKMVSTKGGYLKRRPQELPIFLESLDLYETYLGTYDFMENVPFHTLARTNGVPESRGVVMRLLDATVKAYYAEREIEIQKRTEYTKAKMPLPDSTDLTHSVNEQINSAEADMNYYEDEVSRYRQEMMTCIRKYRVAQASYLDLEEQKDQITSDEYRAKLHTSLSRVTGTGFWSYVGIGKYKSRYSDEVNLKPHLVYYISQTIEMGREDNKTDPYNFGRMILEINLKSRKFFVKPFRDNIALGRSGSLTNISPYISSYGDVCWGNMDEKANQALNNLDFYTPAMILERLLTNYTPSGPYVRYENFVRKRLCRKDKFPDTLIGLEDFKKGTAIHNEFVLESMFPTALPEYRKNQAELEAKLAEADKIAQESDDSIEEQVEMFND